MCYIDIFSALLTPVIVIIATWIAYRQWRTSEDVNKLNKYEKRYSVYQALKDALLEIGREGNISEKGRDQLTIKTGESVFIFDDDVVDYVKTFREKSLRIYQVNRNLSNHIGETKELALELEKLEEWFQDQHQKIIGKFLPYLKFKK